MIVYGIFTFGKAKQRATALRDLVAALDPTEKHKLVMVGGFLEATVKAADSIRAGTVAAVGGCLDDVELPAEHEGFGDIEWRESWLAHLEQSKVAFLPLKSEHPPKGEGGAAASIIRGYNRAAGMLTEAIRKIQSEQRRDDKAAQGGYVCGRPPYGYRVENESFVINDVQSKAVAFIFKQCRAGKNLADIIEALKAKYSDGGVIKGKRQYWDRVKIRRILGHSRLYCLGHYAGGRGQPVHFPALAFLPAAWVDTRPNTNPARAATAVASSSSSN